MADIGINFRATAGYVTDGANETYSLGEAYPTTRGGVTFGWDTDLTGSSRDRNNALDRRLAGIVFSNTVDRDFRIDLPASGQYDVHCAAGDGSIDNNGALWDLQDDASTFVSLSADVIAGTNFDDATDVVRSAAAWPGNELPTTRTFDSQILRLNVREVATNNNVIAHLRVTNGAAAAPVASGRRHAGWYYTGAA